MVANMLVKKNVVINFTSSDFTEFQFGTEKFIHENIELLENKATVFTIIPFLDPKSKFNIFRLRHFKVFCNKTLHSVLDMIQLMEFIDKLKDNRNISLTVWVQNFINFNIEEITKVMIKFKDNQFVCQLHDYSLICTSYNLIDDTGNYCNLNNCLNCSFKDGKYALYKIMEQFKCINVNFIAPSEFVKTMYVKAYPFIESNVLVIPHEHYEIKSMIKTSEPIRIAYLGAQTVIKGWEDFKKICACLKTEYEVFYLGNGQEIVEGVQNVYVSIDSELQMKDAIIKYGINVAFLSSRCPETYCYALYEALECGCFILCNEVSGNVANVVRVNNNGFIYKDLKHMQEFIESSEFKVKVNANKKVWTSRMNISFLEELLPEDGTNQSIDLPSTHTLFSLMVKFYNRIK